MAKPEGSFYQDLAPAELLRGATVFIDESTQITGDMAALILEMKPKRLVMTGDLSQLKPVGSGKPFHDLIHLARANTFGEQVNFVELQIDHRATKELADFTRKLRQGAIPLDYVESYNNDAGATATELLTREASVVECKKLDQVIDIVEQIVTRALVEQKASFCVVSDKTHAPSGTTPLVLTEPHAPQLFAQQFVARFVLSDDFHVIEVPAELFGNRAFGLNREVTHAAPRIHAARRGDRLGRAGIDASGAFAAEVLRHGIRLDLKSGHQLCEEEPRA